MNRRTRQNQTANTTKPISMKIKVSVTTFLKKALLAFLVAATASTAVSAFAGGNSKSGGGGGGSSKPVVVESRVTGYVTAIDYANSTITIGASYYGSGALIVTSSTSISLDNVSCDLNSIEVGDWMEARFEWYSKVATKLSATSF